MASDAARPTVLHLTLAKRQPSYEELVAGLPTAADRMVPGNCVVDTADNEDHTFSGICFDLEAVAGGMPMMFLEIQSVSVRGALGPVSVYTTPHGFHGKHNSPKEWERVYGPVRLAPSMRHYTELPLARPIRLAPGMTCGLYVHSQQPDDLAIVYDNARRDPTYEDAALRIHCGMAHVSNVPFSRQGMWGSAWRPNRAFVGRVRYGVKLLLWRPDVHFRFPAPFGAAVRALLACQLRRRDSREAAAFSAVPVAVVFKILQYLSWDDFGADGEGEEEEHEDEDEDGEDEVEEEEEEDEGDEDGGGAQGGGFDLGALLRAAGRHLGAHFVRDATGRIMRVERDEADEEE